MVDPKSSNFDAKLGRKIQRHSPQRLVRRPLVLPGGVIISAERHKGRIVVRVESPSDER